MIVVDEIAINGHIYRKTYSDTGYFIQRDNILYESAVDSIDTDRTYTETSIRIDDLSETNATPENNALRIKSLEEQSQLLAECILELADIVYADDQEAEN